MLKRKSAEDRKAEIIATALQLADRLGPDRMTATEVAKAIGISQPGIFRHFPTKNALWQAVADHIAARLSDAWAGAIATAGDPKARIRALIRAQLDEIEQTPALPSILFSRELNIENPDLRVAFRNLLAGYQSHLVAAVAEAQAQRTLRGDIVPADAALFLTALVQGLSIRWTLGARGFALATEGARLTDVQLAMMAPEAA